MTTYNEIKDEFTNIRNNVRAIVASHKGVSFRCVQGYIKFSAHNADKGAMLAAKKEVSNFLLSNTSRKWNHARSGKYTIWYHSRIPAELVCGINAVLDKEERKLVLLGCDF